MGWHLTASNSVGLPSQKFLPPFQPVCVPAEAPAWCQDSLNASGLHVLTEREGPQAENQQQATGSC